MPNLTFIIECCQVDLNEESASHEVICGAVDCFIKECHPFLHLSSSGSSFFPDLL